MKRLISILIALIAIGIGFAYINVGPPAYSSKVPDVDRVFDTTPPSWMLFNILTKVSNFARQVSNYLQGPMVFMSYGTLSVTQRSLYAVSKLGLADHIPEEGISVASLAQKTNLKSIDKLFRVIRFLSTEGIFTLDDDIVKLTPIGSYLKSDHPNSFRYCMIHWGEEALDAVLKLPSFLKDDSKFSDHNEGKNIFEIYEEKPESMFVFTKCMLGIFKFTAPAMVSAYDYSNHRVLVDVGGGQGALTHEILRAYGADVFPGSSLNKAVVMDLQRVVQYARTNHSMVSFVGGNFFQASTIPKGDALVICGVLHDWPDHDATNILRNARMRLEDEGVLLVYDFVVDKESTSYNTATLMDVFMTSILNGPFRTQEEYSTLFTSAELVLVETRKTRSLNTLFILKKN